MTANPGSYFALVNAWFPKGRPGSKFSTPAAETSFKQALLASTALLVSYHLLMGQLNFRLPERPPPLLSYPGQPMLTSPTVHSGTLDFIIPRLDLRLQKGNAETRQYLKKWKVGRECCDLIAVFWDVSLC